MQMGLGLNVSQRLEQKLSPQMIQSLKLLQVTALQLETMIAEELEVNPLLEKEDEILEITKSEEEEPIESKEKEEALEELKDVESLEKKEEVDWDAFFEDGFDPGFKKSEEKSTADNPLERLTPTRKSLQDNLITQLQIRHLSPKVKEFVEYLINCLDDDGILAPISEELKGQVMVDEDGDLAEIQKVILGEINEQGASHDVREAFHVLRSLDPPGIGAKNLQECLLIQIYRKGGVSELAEKIVTKYFDYLQKLKISALAKRLDILPEEVQSAIREIGRLEPKPGRTLNESISAPITPDVLVENIDGEIVLVYNERFAPSIRVSKNYSKILNKGSKASGDEKKFVREKLNSASWLIKAIEQRKSTIIKVMSSIIDTQPDFFTEGPAHLKPLILQDIADRIEMHISTVSRVINGKYVQTPHGIFELKYFFTSGVTQNNGTDISSMKIKDEIKKMIESETPKKPLSDQKIADLLKVKGFEVARRTIAKYRDQLEILPARLRKQF